MATMNWERRNVMEKVWYRDPLPSNPKEKFTKKKIPSNKIIEAKFDAKCASCLEIMEKDSKIRFFFSIRKATHLTCKKPK